MYFHRGVCGRQLSNDAHSISLPRWRSQMAMDVVGGHIYAVNLPSDHECAIVWPSPHTVDSSPQMLFEHLDRNAIFHFYGEPRSEPSNPNSLLELAKSQLSHLSVLIFIGEKLLNHCF